MHKDAFQEYGWERLDDLLDESVTADEIVAVCQNSDYPIKKALAAGLLRWAREDEETLQRAASLKVYSAAAIGHRNVMGPW